MQSFYQFYQKMLKEAFPGQQMGVPTPPIQGGQTSPAVPPNPMSDPKVAQAFQTISGIKDPKFQQAFLQFQKAAGIQTGAYPQQNPTSPQALAGQGPMQQARPPQAPPASAQPQPQM